MYITSFSKYFENKSELILYHGSPYVFENFKNETTFFSKTEEFARRYADTKSFDYALDREPNIYKVKVDGNIFDINNPEHEKKLRPLLPEKIKYVYNNFGFDAQEDKEEFILNMKGYYTNKPYKEAVEAEVGDEIPDPTYPVDKFLVVKRDNEYVYTIDKKSFNRKLDIPYYLSSSKDYQKPIVEFLKKYIKDDYDGYAHEGIWRIYIHLFHNGKSYFDIDKPEQKYLDEFNRLYSKMREDVINEFIKEKYYKRWNIETKVQELSDSWRYYENDTILPTIQKLGFDGYVAKEEKVNTYAIFHPNKTVEILEYDLYYGSFDSWDEVKSYWEFSKGVANIIKNAEDKDELLKKYDRWDEYNFWAKSKAPEDFVNVLRKVPNGEIDIRKI